VVSPTPRRRSYNRAEAGSTTRVFDPSNHRVWVDKIEYCILASTREHPEKGGGNIRTTKTDRASGSKKEGNRAQESALSTGVGVSLLTHEVQTEELTL
jgi:hypothetical protein